MSTLFVILLILTISFSVSVEIKKDNEAVSSLDQLPDELLQHTATMMNEEDLISCSMVSHRLYDTVDANDIILNRIRNDYAAIFDFTQDVSPENIRDGFQRIKMVIDIPYIATLFASNTRGYLSRSTYHDGSVNYSTKIPFLCLHLRFMDNFGMTLYLKRVVFTFELDGEIRSYDLQPGFTIVDAEFIVNLLQGISIEFDRKLVCLYQHDMNYDRFRTWQTFSRKNIPYNLPDLQDSDQQWECSDVSFWWAMVYCCVLLMLGWLLLSVVLRFK